jgi:hypothetical protein
VKLLMKLPIFIDGRNLYETNMMYDLGFIYRGMGRGYGRPAANAHGGKAGGAAKMSWNGWNAVVSQKEI